MARSFPAKRAVLTALLLSAALPLSSCQDAEGLRQQRMEKADRHFDEIKKRVPPTEIVFTLPMCIESALRNNLEVKAGDLKEAIAREKRTAEMLGMLPDLSVNLDYTSRSNQPGSSSQSLLTGQQSLVYSRSSEKQELDTRVSLMLSTLDFGLAYFNSLQAHDKIFVEQQENRRTAQNLITEVVSSYFKVAATQFAMESSETLLRDNSNIDETLAALAKDKTISPMRALDERKQFITQRKRLMEYRRSYEQACLELRALMGYMPTKEIRVDTKCLEQLRPIAVPDVELLTRIALNERPEFYQLDLQEHMLVLEARKTILMMFPNVRIVEAYNKSDNKFLYNQSWWELGIHAAYNLLKLPQQIQQYRTIDKQADEVDLRTIVMAVGVMSQVRIAQSAMDEQKERFELDQQIYAAYKEHLDFARNNASILGKISPLEISRLELETTETAIDRAHSLSNYYLSYYRLLNTLGIEAIDQKTVSETIARLAERARQEQEREEAMAAKTTRPGIAEQVLKLIAPAEFEAPKFEPPVIEPDAFQHLAPKASAAKNLPAPAK